MFRQSGTMTRYQPLSDFYQIQSVTGANRICFAVTGWRILLSRSQRCLSLCSVKKEGQLSTQGLLSVLTLNRGSSTPVYCILPKIIGGRLQLNTFTLLTQRSRSGLTTLSRHSAETHQGKRAHAQLVKERLVNIRFRSLRGLTDLHLKKIKKSSGGE